MQSNIKSSAIRLLTLPKGTTNTKIRSDMDDSLRELLDGFDPEVRRLALSALEEVTLRGSGAS